jgi:hypothetical protein
LTWQPLRSVPSALELALCDTVRAVVSQLDLFAGISRTEDGDLDVALADGSRLRVNLRIAGRTATTFGPRQAVRYDLEGQAVFGGEGMGLAAHATLDIKTRAFLDVACTILWRSRERV